MQAKCKARNAKTGKPCGNYAVKGSTGVCYQHGAATPQAQRRIRERLAEAEVHAQAVKAVAANGGVTGADLNPVEALFDIAAEIVNFQRAANGMLAELSDADWRRDHRAGEQIHGIVTIFERSLDRAAKILVELNKLGLEERRVRVQEREVAMLNRALENILDRLELTPDQLSRSDTIVIEELEAIAAGDSAESGQPVYTGRSQPAALTRAR